MNRETFNHHSETQPAPTLKKDEVVILDNRSLHKSSKLKATCERFWPKIMIRFGSNWTDLSFHHPTEM